MPANVTKVCFSTGDLGIYGEINKGMDPTNDVPLISNQIDENLKEDAARIYKVFSINKEKIQD